MSNNINYFKFAEGVYKNMKSTAHESLAGLNVANESLYGDQFTFGSIADSENTLLANLVERKQISDKDSQSIADAVSQFASIVSGKMSRENFGSTPAYSFTNSQVTAMMQAVPLHADVSKTVANIGNYKSDARFVNSGIQTVSAESVSGDYNYAMSSDDFKTNFGISKESFDGSSSAINTTYAMVLSSVTARPEDMLAFFFPSVVMKHDEHKFRMVIDVANFVQQYDRERNSDGLVKGKAKSLPILKNLFNPEIMEKDVTRILPYCKNNANNQVTYSKYKFVTKHTFEDFETGFYLPFKKIDIIGASQSDVDLKKTPADSTDALLPTLKMHKILAKIKTTDKAAGEDLIFNIEDVAGATWTAAQQGNVQGMQLNMRDQFVSIKLGTTVNADGNKATFGTTVDNATFQGFVLNFTFTLTGYSVLPDAEVSVEPGNSGTGFLKLAKVYNANGIEVPLTDPSITNLVAQFTDSELLGYTLHAYRANTNFKKTGQNIELKAFAIEFAVNYKNPISVLSSVNNFTGDTLLDWSLLKQTITAVSSACNYRGLTAIIDHAAKLKERVLIPFDADDQVDYNMANHVVSPYYKEHVIDISKLDSLTSSNRLEDVQAALLSKIAKLGMDMYMNSNYMIAFEEFMRGEGKKPTLVLGTDPLTASYLTYKWTEPKIALNNILDLVVVTTVQPRMRKTENGAQSAGKGFLTFTLQDKIGEMSKPHLLHYGFMPMSPVINVVIDNKQQNGGLVKQAFVIPRYDYYAMLPIMTSLTFTGYSDALDKVALSAQIVTPGTQTAWDGTNKVTVPF